LEKKKSEKEEPTENKLDVVDSKGLPIKTHRPPKKTSFMFSPSTPATTYHRNKETASSVQNKTSLNLPTMNTAATSKQQQPPSAIGHVSDFATNPSRRKICAFCGVGDEPVVPIIKNVKTKDTGAGLGKTTSAAAAAAVSSSSSQRTNQRLGNKRKSSLARAALKHLEASSLSSSSSSSNPSSNQNTTQGEGHRTGTGGYGGLSDAPQELPKPPIKWGLKPREIFIACPYGLVSDLACWPCLAANSKSSHAEQQANVTMPYRAHAARFHTSETVNGWNFAPPATTVEACVNTSGGTGASALRGFRSSMQQEPLAVKKQTTKSKDGQLYAYTSPHLVKYGPPEDVGISLDNPGLNRDQGPYEPVPSVKYAIGLAKQIKPKAVEERSETEEGWIREAEDDLVLDSRFNLDKRLNWVNETAIRIAPLVKAQFRRALVQDRELRRRRIRLEKRAADLVEIKGGIGTGVISGEAWIPALPTLTELANAKTATEAAFKSAMRQRAYTRVTSLEEQLVAIESRQATIGREERLAEEAYLRELEEANRPKPRPTWDQVEGEFRHSKPLLRSLKRNQTNSTTLDNDEKTAASIQLEKTYGEIEDMDLSSRFALTKKKSSFYEESSREAQ